MSELPRTQEELAAAAADVERWLDNLDSTALDNPASRADDLRAIGTALEEVALGERHLAQAVRAARANGRSWGAIGMALGVSKQAARKRFGDTFDLSAVPPVPITDVNSPDDTGRFLDSLEAALALFPEVSRSDFLERVQHLRRQVISARASQLDEEHA